MRTRYIPDDNKKRSNTFPSREICIAYHYVHQQKTDLNFLRNFRSASNVVRPDREALYIMTNVSAPSEFTDPRHLVLPVAPAVYNRSMGLPFTAPIVPQTPARVSIGHWFPMTGNSMTNTPARMRSSPTHGLMNGIGNANQTIVVTDLIPILGNLNSYELRQFIEIITSRAVDNDTALLRSTDSTPITFEQNQFWFNNDNIPIVEVLVSKQSSSKCRIWLKHSPSTS